MTKADLIDEVSRSTELTHRDSETIVQTIFERVVANVMPRSMRVEFG
jgi:nucleoid DNA-binding protein